MLKFTAENVPDDQIRALGSRLVSEGRHSAAMWCDYALLDDPTRFDIPEGCDRQTARQRCADMINGRALPEVGQHVTEGMGRYRVTALLGGSLLEVESHMGNRLTIDWCNSGYRDPRNAWRLA